MSIYNLIYCKTEYFLLHSSKEWIPYVLSAVPEDNKLQSSHAIIYCVGVGMCENNHYIDIPNII